ncbi:hypothetical protein MAFF211471_25870 [Ralstonia solanacearum]|nr:hypothetical protein MAFF211471_25870 [Ralstonia solanacearum]BEU46138.1 hypothetical protein MAFF211519_14630 [Ralstonia pseudosolanacearum]BCL92843.1 hypothetical protein MAFF211479_25440 [Ralstonia solanacearum]BCL96774.1 hypothetical protein MAFF211491_12260 [Ralstonia solanacearum]BCM03110.1 hypothetical protein MAFF301560_24970 [Ralstonia solanacearum]
MLATPVRVERHAERDIRGLVAAQDRARPLDGDGGLQSRWRVRILLPDERLPTVIDAGAFVALEAALQIGGGATPLARNMAIG